jgi:hypothetical protein
MIGFRSIAVAVRCVERLSLSCQCFLSRIRITACWRGITRSVVDLWNTAPGKKRRLCLRIRIAYPILPHSVVGRTGGSGLDGVVDSLLAAQHVLEMFRRALPKGPSRKCLDRLSNRLSKILSEARKLPTP